MSVLVDTSVWSLALRRRRADLRREETEIVKVLRDLIEKDKARILGVVRQELLSGIRTGPQFEDLKTKLDAFSDVEATAADYIEAARLGNLCRAKGIAVSLVDMLQCGVAKGRGWEIFTTDLDFVRYSKILGIRIHANFIEE